MLLEMILELILGMKKDETGASGNDDPFIDAGETEEAGTGETDAPSAADYAGTYATDGLDAGPSFDAFAPIFATRAIGYAALTGTSTESTTGLTGTRSS